MLESVDTNTHSPDTGGMPAPRSLARFAWLSIGAAIVTIALKTSAYLVTGSVGLLSDAVESLVNLAGAMVALAMLSIAARPPDEEHVYGHSKAEYLLERRRRHADPGRGDQHRLGGDSPADRAESPVVGGRRPRCLDCGGSGEPGDRRGPAARGSPVSLGHARSQRASPADRRLDVSRRSRGHRCGGAHGVEPARSVARAGRGDQYRVHRRADREDVGARPHGCRPAVGRGRGGRGGA